MMLVPRCRSTPFWIISSEIRPARLLVETAQDLRAAVILRHLDAQTIQDTGELTGDIAAADDQDRLGQLSRWKISLLVIACSQPGISGFTGQPPVATGYAWR